MKVLTETQNYFPARTEEPLASLQLNIRGREFNLKHARMGNDFVFGIGTNCLLAVPAKRVSALRGCIPNQIEQLQLVDFLTLQKTPVRLELEVDGKKSSSWLLNITGNWLRITTRTGVEWVHSSALVMARIGPVHNPMQ